MVVLTLILIKEGILKMIFYIAVNNSMIFLVRLNLGSKISYFFECDFHFRTNATYGLEFTNLFDLPVI